MDSELNNVDMDEAAKLFEDDKVSEAKSKSNSKNFDTSKKI